MGRLLDIIRADKLVFIINEVSCRCVVLIVTKMIAGW